MSILGIGVDLTEVDRIEKSIADFGEKFLDRIFTADEQVYCQQMKRPAIHFAARFAAKEAVAKALGTGFGEEVHWQEIETCRDERGKPSITLHGDTAHFAESLGVRAKHLSLSHTDRYAVAQVVLEGDSA